MAGAIVGDAVRPEARRVKPETRLAQHTHTLLEHVQALLEILVVATFVATFVVQPFRIPSESMEPTLLVGDFLLGNRQAFAPSAAGGVQAAMERVLPPTAVHRGDLILFRYPPDPSLHLVKRVVGLPGDRLRMREGQVWVNESPLAEPWASHAAGAAVRDDFRDNFPTLRSADPNIEPQWWAQLRRVIVDGEITVPAGHYFVLGDNRNNSVDSRYWGFVPGKAIVGRPLVVYFSMAPPVMAAGSARLTLLERVESTLHRVRVLR